VRIMVTGDWHFGSQGGRIDAESGLNAALMGRYRCARFAIEDGIARGADLILHAGDVFDGCRPTPTEVWLAHQAFAPACEANVPVIVLVGNHDAPKAPAEHHAVELLHDLAGVTVVDRPQILYLCDCPGPKTEVFDFEPANREPPIEVAVRCQIACVPWPNKQLLLADPEARKQTPEGLNLLVREKMMDVIRGLADQRVPGLPSILLGHFSVDMGEAGQQRRLMGMGGDWTLNAQELLSLGFDYYALGHIHKPQEIGANMAYCGSPEAVDFGEEEECKRYLLLNLEAVEGGGTALGVEEIPTPYRRLITVEWQDEEGTAIEDATGTIVRVKVAEAQQHQVAEIRRAFEAAGAYEVRVEIERAEVLRRRVVDVSAETTVADALRAYIAQRPDLAPMTDGLIAEAQAVEQALEGGAA